MVFLDPRNDVAFKKIFGSEEHKNITISFLNSILEYTGERAIKSIIFLNTEQHEIVRLKKDNILDILCTDHTGYQYIVEMQVEKVKEFGKRMVYYGAKTYSMQLGKGKPYHKLSPVIVVAIIDFTMFPDKKDYKSIHHIADAKTGENDLDQLYFAFVELPKFKKKESELQSAEDKWIYFIKSIKRQTQIPAPLARGEFEEACNVAQRAAWSEDELNAYDDAFVRETDAQTAKELALEKGMAQGLKEGLEKGRNEERRVMAQQLLAKLSIPEISQITGLSFEEIEQLKKKS